MELSGSRMGLKQLLKWRRLNSTIRPSAAQGFNRMMMMMATLIPLILLLLMLNSKNALTHAVQHESGSNNNQRAEVLHKQHNPRAALDEEINIDEEPNYFDYERTSAAGAAAVSDLKVAGAQHSSGKHDNKQQSTEFNNNNNNKINSNLNTGPLEQQASAADANDPFAVTFEDYLKEASKSSADLLDNFDEADSLIGAGSGSRDSESSFVSSNDEQSQEGRSLIDSIPDEEFALSSSGVETDEQSLVGGRKKESSKANNSPPAVDKNIDFIFPASSKQEEAETTRQSKSVHHSQHNSHSAHAKSDHSDQVISEFKLLFTWKVSPTSKCSKSCGKGFKLNRLSCIDLKYTVKVENEVCQIANIPKPSETSHEFCNQIDCPPEWQLVVNNEGCSNSTASSEGSCKLTNVRCSMLNKDGVLVYLDDWHCDQSTKSKFSSAIVTSTTSPSDPGIEANMINRQHLDNKMTDSSQPMEETISFDELEMNESKNEIGPFEGGELGLPPWTDHHSVKADNHHNQHHYRHHNTQHHHANHHPFYQAESWSECMGVRCGELGKRTRKLRCRMFLKRSMKYIDLPESDCNPDEKPPTDEPCYIDCKPENREGSNHKKKLNQHHKKTKIIDIKSSYNSNIDDNEEDADDEDQQQNNIELVFAWKELPTSSCSKSCGKGFRVNHLYCIDLRYNVRVEDDLCKKSTAIKPNATTTDLCNEIDCPPQWLTVEYHGCNPASSKDASCQPYLYKRVQCTMLNKYGSLVYIDDRMCNNSSKPTANQSATSTNFSNTTQQNDATKLNKQTQSKESSQAMDEVVNLDELIDNEKNDILSNIDSSGMEHNLGLYGLIHPNFKGGLKSHHRPLNEPFFEPGPWSECAGASCGELGKRTRNLSCRIYLSRSFKIVELPNSSCHNAQAPDHEEPCYIDCKAHSVDAQKKTKKSFCPND